MISRAGASLQDFCGQNGEKSALAMSANGFARLEKFHQPNPSQNNPAVACLDLASLNK